MLRFGHTDFAGVVGFFDVVRFPTEKRPASATRLDV